MQSAAQTASEYLASLPELQRQTMAQLRKLILKHLPKGYEEGMDYGMIGYYIPLARYPDTYNKHPLGYIALAMQKNHLSLYMMGIYSKPGAETWLREAFAKAGKKLDMGKSCIRFKTLDDLPLDVIAEAVALLTPEAYIALYEQSRKQ